VRGSNMRRTRAPPPDDGSPASQGLHDPAQTINDLVVNAIGTDTDKARRDVGNKPQEAEMPPLRYQRG
jgi:hypothetical protein